MQSDTRDREPRAGIDLPAPTTAPLFFAMGLALMVAGLVTHPLVSAVGGVTAVVGAIGIWLEVFARHHEVHVPLQPESERPGPVRPRADAVEQWVAGEQGHRLRLPIEVRPLSSGLRGGAVGGVAMAIVACAYGLLAHGSPWLPINLLAAMALPSLEGAGLEQLRAFDAGALALAAAMHVVISLLVGLVYAAILPMLPGRPLVWGGIVAPVLWSGLAWASLGLVAPALDQHIQWVWFVASQIAFGLAAGVVLSRSEPIRTLQSFSLAARAGIEAAGVRPEAGEEE